jgi:hypothetical protein
MGGASSREELLFARLARKPRRVGHETIEVRWLQIGRCLKWNTVVTTMREAPDTVAAVAALACAGDVVAAWEDERLQEERGGRESGLVVYITRAVFVSRAVAGLFLLGGAGPRGLALVVALTVEGEVFELGSWR